MLKYQFAMANWYLSLRSICISGNLLLWLTSFLSNRQQTVNINNNYSEWSDVLSGVPQGSVLGPILFIIYINDLSNSCPGLDLLYLFADDVKCFSVVDSVYDYINFQNSLLSISN